MDYRNDAAGTEPRWRNTILYGHRVRNGTMFTGLNNYLEQSFFEQNRRFSFQRLHEEQQWEIFSVHVAGTDFGSGSIGCPDLASFPC